MTAFSISAEELLRQSQDLYALLLLQSLPPAGGPEGEGEFRRRINEYILHDEYYKSVEGEDGEEPLDPLGCPPYTDMGSYPYSGPPTDLVDTVSLPRRPLGAVWRPELSITSRSP